MSTTDLRTPTAPAAAVVAPSAPAGRRRLAVALAVAAVAAAGLAGTGAAAVRNTLATPDPTRRLRVVDRVASSVVPRLTRGYAVAACDPGETLLGGGLRTVALGYAGTITPGAPADLYPVLANRPDDRVPTSWVAGVDNRSDSNTLVVAHAECTPDPVRTTVVRSAPGPVGSDVTIACPAGSAVLSGGWAVRRRVGQVVDLRVSAPATVGSARAWRVRTAFAQGSDTDPATVDASAVCATSGIASTAWTRRKVTIPAGGPAEATSARTEATCMHGAALTGAGITQPSDARRRSLTAIAPAGKPGTWALVEYSLPGPDGASVTNPGGTSTVVTVCATPSPAPKT